MLSPEIENELCVAFMGSFMQPSIYFDYYFEVETTHGTEIVPGGATTRTATTLQSYFADYVEGDITNPDEECHVKHGWLCRLSASGYMDCTEWAAFKTADEAARYLIDTYGE